MNIQNASVQLGGISTPMSDEGDHKWSATLTAPGITSHNLPGGYYPITLTFTAADGTVVTKSGVDLASLRLVVKETIAPEIKLLSPVNESIILDPLTPIQFSVIDEPDGSGVDLNTILLILDGVEYDVNSPEISYSVNANGY